MSVVTLVSGMMRRKACVGAIWSEAYYKKYYRVFNKSMCFYY